MKTGRIVAMGLTSEGVTCGQALAHLSLRTNGVWNYSDVSLTSCTASAMFHTAPAIVPAQ